MGNTALCPLFVFFENFKFVISFSWLIEKIQWHQIATCFIRNAQIKIFYQHINVMYGINKSNISFCIPIKFIIYTEHQYLEACH